MRQRADEPVLSLLPPLKIANIILEALDLCPKIGAVTQHFAIADHLVLPRAQGLQDAGRPEPHAVLAPHPPIVFRRRTAVGDRQFLFWDALLDILGRE